MDQKELNRLAREYIKADQAIEAAKEAQRNITRQVVEAGSSVAYFLCNIVPAVQGGEQSK